jgi:hypothetical protein
MVHLRALIELSGEAWPVTGHTDTGWLAHSDRLADIDAEPSVVSMGVDADLDRDALPRVAFAAGGAMVRGATAVAAALHTDADLFREDSSGSAVDRSQEKLGSLGFTRDQLRSLAAVWLHADRRSALAVVHLDHPKADDALHELRCRFAEFHTELDHLSASDATRLGVDATGSIQIVAVTGVSMGFDSVVERSPAIVAAGQGPAALTLTGVLFDPAREHSTSTAHDQRVRRIRRKHRTDQLLERVLGR